MAPGWIWPFRSPLPAGAGAYRRAGRARLRAPVLRVGAAPVGARILAHRLSRDLASGRRRGAARPAVQPGMAAVAIKRGGGSAARAVPGARRRWRAALA